MYDDFHPARLRGLMSVLLDVVFAMLVLVVLLTSVLTLLSDNARDQLARAYARQFGSKTETDCPAAFGNAFWFACASEVRRINIASATGAPHSGLVRVADPPAGAAPRAKPAPAVKAPPAR